MRIPEDLELELLLRYDKRFIAMFEARHGFGYEYKGKRYLFLKLEDDKHFPFELITFLKNDFAVLDYVFFENANNEEQLSYIIDNAESFYTVKFWPVFIDKYGIKFYPGRWMKIRHKIKKLLRGITE